MAFSPETSITLLSSFGWKISRRTEVLDALSQAELDPVLEVKIQSLLSQLQLKCQAIEDSIACDDAALIEMDVLKWDGSKKGRALMESKDELVQKIANLLDLEWCPPNYRDLRPGTGSLKLKRED